VTFDDGLKSNLTLAYPILSEYRVPATIYVATALIDRQLRFGGMIWTDYLRGLIRTTQVTSLDLSVLGLGQFDLSSDASRSDAEQALPRALKKIESDDREKMIAVIAEKLGGKIAREYAEPFEGMTWDELRTIDRTGLIEIGAHTVNHAILSTISPEQAEQEMAQSQARLEKELNHPIRHFAYPNGTRADFSELHMQMAARHFDSAVSTIEGLVESQHGRYDLRRINIGNDMSLTEFKLRLSGTLQLLGI
jgi:peptidoglycan/xylan/chitin deacetylase (PgdA/CDA1 family)